MNRPDIRPVVGELFDLLKKGHKHIVIYENGTVVLLKNKDDDINALLNKYIKANQEKTPTAARFFNLLDKYYINILAHPDVVNICNYSIDQLANKFSPPVVDKPGLISSAKKDIQGNLVFFDSRVTPIDAYKTYMYFVVDLDVKMTTGQTATQIAHACGALFELMERDEYHHRITNRERINWKESGTYKIVLAAHHKEFLEICNKNVNNKDMIVVKDKDIAKDIDGSITVIGFKPMYKKDLPDYMASLKVL